MATTRTEQGSYRQPMRFSVFATSLDEGIRGGVRPAKRLLLGAIGFLLLFSRADVANLVLVRGDARLREMSVRAGHGRRSWASWQTSGTTA